MERNSSGLLENGMENFEDIGQYSPCATKLSVVVSFVTHARVRKIGAFKRPFYDIDQRNDFPWKCKRVVGVMEFDK